MIVLQNSVGLSSLYYLKKKNRKTKVLADKFVEKWKTMGSFYLYNHKTKNPPTAWKTSCSILYKTLPFLSHFHFSKKQTTPHTKLLSNHKKKQVLFAFLEVSAAFCCKGWNFIQWKMKSWQSGDVCLTFSLEF